MADPEMKMSETDSPRPKRWSPLSHLSYEDSADEWRTYENQTATTATADTAGITDTMTSQPGRQERVIHQDYIVRQRYSNALPPPPGAPKLLDIPTEGLALYTSPGFASRLARQQPLNIEADAFLGMPIDLVGMPGIFDGDESSIQAPLNPPPVHPRDRALLRPLKSLGQPKTETAGVSFLRRTQYTADEANRTRIESNTSRNLVNSTLKKRRPTDASKDEPINILRSAIKGFDIAYPEDAYRGPDTSQNIRGAAPTPAEVEAWKNPKHPTNSQLILSDTYAVLPDLDALTDSVGYMVVKFAGNPTNSIDAHDERMDVAMLHPIDLSPGVLAELHAKAAAHEANPLHNPAPGPPAYNYELFIPPDQLTARNVKKKFNIDDPEKDDPKLYTNTAKNARHDSFRFNHLRVYDTGLQSSTIEHPYKEVALALHDPDLEQQMASVKMAENVPSSDRLKKAIYYYPVISKTQLKPRRNQNLAQLGLAGRTVEDEGEKIDAVDLVIRDSDEAEGLRRAAHRAEIDIHPNSS